MPQTKQEKRPEFNFAAGTGVIRSKIGTDLTTMYFGRVALPGHGQCYIDGRAAKTDAEMKLSVKRATDRKVIATLKLPRGEMPDREGSIKEQGKGGKAWKVRATIRETDGQFRLVLRLPEVKILAPNAF